MADAVPQCQGQHSHGEGGPTPEAMGTSDQHWQIHLAGPTPGSAHARLSKERASSMKTLDTRFWHTRKQVLKQVQWCRGHPPHPSPLQMSLGMKSSSSRTKNLTTPARRSGNFLSSATEAPRAALSFTWQKAGGKSARLLLQGSAYPAGDREERHIPSPPRLMSWAPALKVVRNSTVLVFKLSIFIIKIITSLVKVQMLQHGVKTPLE